MGILDDLAMGLGFKERTADYDARTARTIAAQDAYKAASGSEAQKAHAMFQARKNFNPQTATGNARIFLDRTGGTGYNPTPAQDDRPFTQRLLTSPASTPSPNPYAIGPISMDKPLPRFGLLGLFTGGMSNLFSRDRDPSAANNVGERAMGMLPSNGMGNTPPVGTTPIGTNGQPETTFTEDFSGVDVYNPATDYIEPDFSQTIPATTAGQEFATSQDFLDTVQSAIDTAETGTAPPLSNANFYDPSGAYGMRQGTSSIRRMPNGRFVDTLTGRIIF